MQDDKKMNHDSPAFLEPAPQLDNHRINQYESAFRPHLISALKDKLLSRPTWLPSGGKLQIPVPRRQQHHHQQQQSLPSLQPRPRHNSTRKIKDDAPPSPHHPHPHQHHQHNPHHYPEQMSPTMAAASAAAASAAIQGSSTADAFMAGLQDDVKVVSSPIDHTKFLTKNAHIKRPRNAWIHVRTQDTKKPTVTRRKNKR